MNSSSEQTYEAHLETAIQTLFKEALKKGVFSGTAAGFEIDDGRKKDRKIWTFGTTDQSKSARIQESTFFDLASLTKPLVTVLSLLAIMEETGLDIHTPIGNILQRKIPEHMAALQLGQLMAHCSGLPTYRPYFTEMMRIHKPSERRDWLIESILAEKFEYAPGSEHKYSDVGYILLGDLVERITGFSLDTFWSEKILSSFVLQKKLLFNPKTNLKNSCLFAATERCQWSGEMLCGVVHDENCRVMGGVAGHAGLFGTIDGVLQLCGHILSQFKGEERHPAYSNNLLRQVLTRYGDSTWAYGFDTPSKKQSSSGNYFSDLTVGHLGFTGTSFWIDLKRGISIVLLTNRVHPTRENEGIKRFRPKFHNIVMEFLLRGLKD